MEFVLKIFFTFKKNCFNNCLVLRDKKFEILLKLWNKLFKIVCVQEKFFFLAVVFYLV